MPYFENACALGLSSQAMAESKGICESFRSRIILRAESPEWCVMTWSTSVTFRHMGAVFSFARMTRVPCGRASRMARTAGILKLASETVIGEAMMR